MTDLIKVKSRCDEYDADWENVQVADYHDDDRDDDRQQSWWFYKMKVCFQTSLGFFLSVFLLPPKSRGAQGERLVPGVL